MRGSNPQSVFDGGEGSDKAGERLEVEGFAGVIVSFQRRGCLHHTAIFAAGHQLTTFLLEGKEMFP